MTSCCSRWRRHRPRHPFDLHQRGRLPQPPIAQALSSLLVEVDDGFAAFEGEPGRHLLNPMGIVHGGWALTLIDSATDCAANTLLPAESSYTTVETKGNFSRPTRLDTERVRAEGRVISNGRQVITTEARLLSVDGRTLAHGTSTLLILPARNGSNGG
ncbi:PaaI family thioesterase [Cupriavidus necator]